LFFSCKTEPTEKSNQKEQKESSIKSATNEKAAQIPSYNYSELEALLFKNDDKTYVVNFWATWCAPCVKELPAFEKLYATYKKDGVEVLLVSLDFPSQKESKLIPFINAKNLQSKVVLMTDPDQDVWISKISKNWSGTIPATLIYNKEKRQFYEQSFEYTELETAVKEFLK
jgi:thiol-disulfide isomerase/thioredoxin